MKYRENYQLRQRHEVGKWHWKNGPKRLARRRVATSLQLVKKKKSWKHNKMRYARNSRAKIRPSRFQAPCPGHRAVSQPQEAECMMPSANMDQSIQHQKRHLHVPSEVTCLRAPGTAGPRSGLAGDDRSSVYRAASKAHAR